MNINSPLEILQGNFSHKMIQKYETESNGLFKLFKLSSTSILNMRIIIRNLILQFISYILYQFLCKFCKVKVFYELELSNHTRMIGKFSKWHTFGLTSLLILFFDRHQEKFHIFLPTHSVWIGGSLLGGKTKKIHHTPLSLRNS